jgi:hypothetical protein
MQQIPPKRLFSSTSLHSIVGPLGNSHQYFGYSLCCFGSREPFDFWVTTIAKLSASSLRLTSVGMVLPSPVPFIIFIFAQQPPVGQGLLIQEVSRSHSTTHHNRYDSYLRVISSSQRPPPDNTQLSK